MDRDIARAVLATLEERGMLPHGKVWVAVNNGWVTLKGHVDGESQRAAAVALTSGQLGVRGVIDSITVASLNDPI
jgi:osmotically-inducible protein OsmY